MNIDAFYAAPPFADVNEFDECPLDGSELLPADDTYPFTLFVLAGQLNRTVYACEMSRVVTVAEFDFVGTVTQVPSITPRPTVVRHPSWGQLLFQ